MLPSLRRIPRDHLDAGQSSGHASDVDPAIRELLESTDARVKGGRDPKIFWVELDKRVKRLVPKLERIADGRADLDDSAQLAAFFADLTIWMPGSNSELGTAFTVRFSNFGWLFTTWGEYSPGRVNDTVVTEVVEAVSEAGFRFVPRSALDEPYTGRDRHFVGWSWWEVFFEY